MGLFGKFLVFKTPFKYMWITCSFYCYTNNAFNLPNTGSSLVCCSHLLTYLYLFCCKSDVFSLHSTMCCILFKFSINIFIFYIYLLCVCVCLGGRRGERGKREEGRGDLSFIREVPELKLRSSGSKCLHPFLIKNKTVSRSP